MNNTEQTTIELFSGTPGALGGLSNERELVELLPEEFNKALHRPFTNKWIQYASKCFFSGANVSDWSWTSDDESVQFRQLRCLKAALAGFGLKHEHKEALCGWMLSEMLTEVPA